MSWMLRFKFRVILFHLISYCSDFTLTAIESFPNLRGRFVLICPLCPLLSLLASFSLASRVTEGVAWPASRFSRDRRCRFSFAEREATPSVTREWEANHRRWSLFLFTKGCAKRTKGDTKGVSSPLVSRKARSGPSETSLCEGLSFYRSMEPEAGQKSYNHIDAVDEGQAPITKLRRDG